MKNLKNNFLKYCLEKKLQINDNQIKVINLLNEYYNNCFKKKFFSYIFKYKSNKIGFYLFGDVGVGKTMLLNFFFENLKIKKKRVHFNEFMINFHEFVHKRKEIDKSNSIDAFVKRFKEECELVYFDEFQVTNIVDAMILGRLFKKMFNENIKILVTSNIKIEDLYKDGLQREQFLPFIKTMNEFCNEIELLILKDYRKLKSNMLDRFFFPLNEDTNFKINHLFRTLTKNKKSTSQKLEIKGRIFEIKNYFEGVARFDFGDLCDQNIGSEDYIKISEVCDFMIIENIPKFHDGNDNLQLRFITLIDILYEKKIPLIVSSSSNIEKIGSSRALINSFKRTVSRLHELTSMKK